jgi:hypothetical protein
MTKKAQKKLIVGASIVGGAAVLGTIIYFATQPKTGGYNVKTSENKVPPTPAATPPPTVNTSTYTPPATTSKYDAATTTAVQKMLYYYYPITIKNIGDIGTNGQPDGIWGTNTAKVVASVIQNYGWAGEAQIIEYAVGKLIVYRHERGTLSGVETATKEAFYLF